jgi:hypothetical protein
MPKSSDFDTVFAALKGVLNPHVRTLAVLKDTPKEFTLVGKVPSPFPQHKGHPLYFATVRTSKAYVSFHLMPMSPKLSSGISPALRKRMQGMTCFNFRTEPEPEILAELKQLTESGYQDWDRKKWL